MSTTTEVTFCYEDHENLEEALRQELHKYGMVGYRIVEERGEGGWPTVEFTGSPESIARFMEDYDAN